MPHDRAHRPDASSGDDPSSSSNSANHPPPGSPSMPDIRGGGGTYFLGRYRVVDEIGIGGMASVHLARMDGPGGFQKWVAIKKIHPHLVEDESFVQMFLDEARVAARISHPNVATVFDLGKHEDTYWIAMEYLHGEPLREVMRRTEELGTAMPPEIACRVIADAAEGLHAAHELLGKNGEKLGLVHRDVTPHNLFVTYDGVTKVVDFGIAKFSSRMSHTRAGTLKGKLAYMSPEQVHGEGIDRRTDIFALGVVLWELTTGQRLFRMESDLDTLAKVQECNVPRPSTLIRGYPVDLEKIVMKALAKNRGERFRTARELSRALQSLLMRRGLFIASDEVAAYTQSIFSDRIQKREAHLRWAAEVTQTINVEQMLSKPKIGPEYTSSEVQAASTGPSAKPRPAAGLPAEAQAPMPQPQPARGYAPQAPQAAPYAPPQGGPPRPGAPAAPRPAAGMPPRGGVAAPAPPAQAYAPPPPAPVELEEEHPADGDGPTIQAPPPLLEALPPMVTRGAGAGRSEPPTITENVPGDGPTMMSDPPRLNDEEGEDQDETMVAANRAASAGGALRAPPTFPQPQQKQTRPPPPQAHQQQQHHHPPPPIHQQVVTLQQPSMPPVPPPMPTGPQRFQQTAALGQISPLGHGYPTPQQSGEHASFGETLGMSGGHPQFPQIGDPNDFGRGQQHPDFIPRGQAPSQMSGEFMHQQQHQQPMMLPRQPPVGDNRTMTAQRFRRRPPMWVVAALSCSIALLIAGIVIAIASSTGGSSSTPRASGSAGAAGVTAPTGPFGSARAAFNAATTGPSSSLPSGSSGSAAATTPPAATAATTATAPPVATAPPATETATPTPAPSASVVAASKPATPTPTPQPQPATPPTPVAKPTPVPVAAPTPTPVAKPSALGAITVVCMPKCDQIVDNGTSLGPGHIFNRPVPAGRHTLSLSAPNGVKKNLVVEVAPEQTREVRISMDK